MEYNRDMPSILLPLAYSFLNPAAHAAPARMLPAAGGWFYADAAEDSRMHVDAQGHLAGVPVYRTGALMHHPRPPVSDRARRMRDTRFTHRTARGGSKMLYLR